MHLSPVIRILGAGGRISTIGFGYSVTGSSEENSLLFIY